MGPQTDQQFLELALLRRKEVEKIVALARSSLERLIAQKSFPAPIRVGKSRRWIRSEVRSWLLEQIEQSRKPAGVR
jgi:predicted DNA-binding transcriptional regulator AlpA